MSTTMSWMIGVLAVMVAYGVAAMIGYRKAKKRGDIVDDHLVEKEAE
ncbi:MAG: hypothetical protein LUC83_01670 [Clostridiales bacterium]|nr:hypothetical protein [Clostridiales bacterium]